MKEKKVKAEKKQKKIVKKEDKTVEIAVEDIENNDFDFGGIPKDVSFKKNIGCGG
ncbi:hypothetical protein EV198_1481 [Roseivirga ehrenbergii]|uniref:hypothetical protein n=1 Tax=Roseivirga ehrenbergii (strain DSM 102268 / JCM 13514 / KCTC 12282 / NCIMB 14502 / KMM 6017) TaxID=279360 RepID=UPI000ABDBDFB|nr:hypothetical protein [Roseivirga ehrenbergii]TCL10451.1 hypothetical protein EV198_1481 [Roseivirga ehrenbergii]